MPKTVVRAGYGLSYLATFTPAGTQGFSSTTPFVATNGSVFSSGNTLSNPYPDGLLTPTGSSLGLATFLGQSITVVNRNRVVPYVHQFSVGIQRELPWRSLIEASYVGSRSRELDVSQQIDDVSLSDLLTNGASLSSSRPNPFAGQLPATSLNTANATLQQLLRPFPQFTGITETNIPVGQSWYNSLQVRFDKRFSHGLNFLVSYTYSRWLEGVTYLNNQDLITTTPARTLTSTDTPHRVVVSGNYALPFFSHAHGIAAVFLKGWQANGIFMREVGFPLAAPSGFYSSGIDPSLPDPTLTRYFNTCTLLTSGNRQNCASTTEPIAFIQQQPFTLRTLSLRFPSLRPAKVPNADVSLFKSFTLHERLRLQFRAEAFNLTNSPQFGQPSTSLTSTSAGVTTLTQVNDPRNIQLALRLMF
jgi:hypothetical protein